MNHVPSFEDVSGLLRLYLMEREAWEECPELGLLRVQAGQLDLWPVPFAPTLWDVWRSPARFLGRLAEVWSDTSGKKDNHAFRKIIPPSASAGIAGIYLRTEAWAARRGLAREIIRRQENGEKVPSIAGKRGAVEIRQVICMTLDNQIYSSVQSRDKPNEITLSTSQFSTGTPISHAQAQKENTVMGRIPDAMSTIMMSIYTQQEGGVLPESG